MNKGKVIVGMTQHSCVPDREENMKTAERLIREAAAKGAKVI
jgi:N-carbamoylputrescine amidase